MRFVMLLLLFCSVGVQAHQWTPTYPKLIPSYVDGVLTTQLELFNSRSDVGYYEIGVFDEDMNPVKFATAERIIPVDHLRRVKVDIFIREQDRDKAVYICSKSKHPKDTGTKTLIASRICSKIK